MWKTILTIQAKTMLEDIQDRRVQEKIRDRINGLVDEPEKQGKLLTGKLTGYRSLRAVGQRYRIIYRVEEDRVLVLVVAIGIRKEGNQKDIYSLARKILRLRLLEPPQE
ncbi:MAG TPA: plasmid stabilization protein [Desulfotomaculum sp.]|nr:plasmid stabilization protein [Desulfotomaculum sp.]